MAIINNIDLGSHPTWAAPLSTRKGTSWGADTQTVIIEGGQSLIWARAGTVRKRSETVWITSSPPSPVTALKILRQLQETVNNPALQPVYIQWASGGGNIVADSEDGWYVLESVVPDVEIIVDGTIPVTITASYYAAGIALKGLAVSYIGAQGNLLYTGLSIPEVAFPVNADSMAATILTRPGGEGSVPVSTGPNTSGIVSPLYFRPSSTVSDLFKNRCSVWDTINTSSNPVPTGGGFVNANWVEIFHPDHIFLGDCIITNGHILLLLASGGSTNIIQFFVWNWITPGWLATDNITGKDPSSNAFSTRSFSLQGISHYESSVKLFMVSASANHQILLNIRVPRGEFYARLQVVPLTFFMTTTTLTCVPASAPKIQYTEVGLRDPTLAAEQGFNFPPDIVYGWNAQFTNNTSFPFITGFLYLSSIGLPGVGLTGQGQSGSTGIALGDNSPGFNQSGFFGIYALPLVNPQNYQAEAEGGALGTGWSSVADALASAGNTAKVASGTATTNADLFGTSFQPVSGGLYDVWYRVRVTSAASATAQLTFGWWDATAAAFLALSSTTFAPNQFSTSYTWVRSNARVITDGVLNGTTTVTSATAVFTAADVGKLITGIGIPVIVGTPVTIASVTNVTTILLSTAAIISGSSAILTIGAPATPVTGHNMQFRVVTAATLGTDFFIDEAVLAPKSGVGSSAQGVSPRECWQAFAFDKSSRIIPV